MTQSIIASILQGLAASYSTASEVEASQEEIIVGRNWTKEMIQSANGTKPKAKAEPIRRESGRRSEVKLDNTGKPLVHGIAMPDKGSLSPRAFLIALRDAGLRTSSEGTKYLDPSEVRHDSIRAIAAYCGYDSRLNYGPQELAAKSKANLELRPIKVNPNEVYRRNGSDPNAKATTPPSVQDMVAARIANLEARERLAAEAFSSHRQDFMNAQRTLDERATSKILMDLEEQRISQIRADLRMCGVDAPVFVNEGV